MADHAPQPQRILIAEADAATAGFLADQLAADGYAPVIARTASHALVLADQRQPALLLLGDVGSHREAIELLASVRAGYAGAADRGMPVLLVTAQSGELEALRAFAEGADDVIAKPFSYPLLRARLAAVLRRAARAPDRRLLRVGSLEIDTVARTVTVAGMPVRLNPREYELLVHLAAQPERVFSKEELLRDLWGFGAPVATRTIDSHVCRLRRKLAPADSRRNGLWVVNVWGVGYRLTDRETPPANGAGQLRLLTPRP